MVQLRALLHETSRHSYISLSLNLRNFFATDLVVLFLLLIQLLLAAQTVSLSIFPTALKIMIATVAAAIIIRITDSAATVATVATAIIVRITYSAATTTTTATTISTTSCAQTGLQEAVTALFTI